MTRATSQPTAGPIEWWAIAMLAAFTVVAIAGYGVFALHPERIPDFQWARTVYNRSFSSFAQIHIVLGAAVLFLALSRQGGLRWVPAFVTVVVLAFTAEHIGTGTGLPFGHYEYTGLLGPKLLGRVPYLIPVSWFLMALPAYVVAHGRFPESGARVKRLLTATALLVVWDLALDPAMSFLTPYWRWAAPGSYYGMPLANLVGWTAVGLLLMGALELFAAQNWAPGLGESWYKAYYLLILGLPVGMMVAAGLWPGVFATLGALAAMLVVLRKRVNIEQTVRPSVQLASAGADR